MLSFKIPNPQNFIPIETPSHFDDFLSYKPLWLVGWIYQPCLRTLEIPNGRLLLFLANIYIYIYIYKYIILYILYHIILYCIVLYYINIIIYYIIL